MDNVKLTYEMPSDSLPIWTHKQKVSIQSATQNSISIVWNEAVGTVTGYKVYQSGSLAADLESTRFSYTFDGLDENQTYTFRVEAVSANGQTTNGPSVTGKTSYTKNPAKLDISPVWTGGGAEGYGSYRIPGIVVSNAGTLLVCAEARRGGGDWDPMDLVMKRSTDGGETWGANQILLPGLKDGITVNNPVMFVDGDTIHLLYCVQYGVTDYNGGVYYRKSTDDGLSWSEPTDISASCFISEFNRRVIATGPGHGIVLGDGTLLVPIWMANGAGQAHQPSVVSTFYSKDSGETWQIGEIIYASAQMPNPNETTAVELSDGRVMLNMRSQTNQKRRELPLATTATAVGLPHTLTTLWWTRAVLAV